MQFYFEIENDSMQHVTPLLHAYQVLLVHTTITLYECNFLLLHYLWFFFIIINALTLFCGFYADLCLYIAFTYKCTTWRIWEMVIIKKSTCICCKNL